MSTVLNPSSGKLTLDGMIRHFHQGKRLRASIYALPAASGKIAVGIARVNKNDVPSRDFGRELAQERCLRGLGLPGPYDDKISPSDFQKLKEDEARRSLFVLLTHDQFTTFITKKAPVQWGNPFGCDPKQYAQYKEKARLQAEKDHARAEKKRAKAKAARAKKAEQHKKAAALAREEEEKQAVTGIIDALKVTLKTLEKPRPAQLSSRR
jgi:hypothetical protein